MKDAGSSFLPSAIGVLLLLMGIGLTGGGAWLIGLGGSWFYALLGLALLAAGWLLWRRSALALWIYAALTAATLAWALWESGLDWWPLATRGGLLFLIGLLLLTPWVTRGLGEPAARRRGMLANAAVLGVALVVAIVAMLGDDHRIEGRLRQAAAPAPPPAIPPGEWHAYGRTGMGQRFSPLDQITPVNVAALEEAWHYHTGDVRGAAWEPQETTFEVTPLKIGDRLFLCTPHQAVIALDPVTGREIWRTDLNLRDDLTLQHLTCRGLSYHERRPDAAAPTPYAPGGPPPVEVPEAAEGAATVADCPRKLYMPTADGRLVALDPDTGGICTGFGERGQINLWRNMPNVRAGGYYSTSPVVATRRLVIVGGTVLDNVSTNEPAGVIRAFDAETGALVWNWDPGNPERTAPLPPGETYVPSTPNSWSISAVDEALGLVYVPMGNTPPDQFGGNRSAEVERFSSSVVALELETGRVRWVFQTVHHDLWDYDVPSQPSLLDLTIAGRSVPALVQPTKQGEIFVLNRETGEPILPVRQVAVPQGAAEGDETAPTQPVSALSFDPPPLTGADMWGATLFDQLACRIQFRRLRYEGRYTPPTVQGSLVYPGNFGVFNWGSIAVDPRRQVAFTTPAYLAFVSRLVPRADDSTLYVQGGNRPEGSLPALNENFGAPFAVQLHPFTSVLGLPCQQPPWGYVAGVDLTTGRIAWQHRNGTVRDASPLPLPFRMGVPDLGGPLMTAGGVAFLSGTIDDFVRAYDVTDGRQIWEQRLPAGGQATPMTYLGEDGRQYLLVMAGGHGSLGTTAGDSVIAYALPR